MKLKLMLVIVIFVLAGCQTDSGPAPLPDQDAAPAIAIVKNFALADGTTLQAAIDRGVGSLKAKGAKVKNLGWKAYPGPEDCGGCIQVNYTVKINKDVEQYSFLVKQGGKAVEGMNDGAKVLLHSRNAPPKSEKAAPPAEEPAKEETKTEKKEEKG